MKNIPIGLSSFMATKDRNYLYVDKTKEILSIIKKNRYASFSRPRRFCKSLTLNTIETLFTYGTEPYFKGTYIAGNNEDGTPRWTEPTYPVLHLDFSFITSNCLEDFRKRFLIQINNQAQKLKVKPITLKYGIAEALEDFALNINQYFVLLIDEYDAPLNALIDDNEAFESILHFALEHC